MSTGDTKAKNEKYEEFKQAAAEKRAEALKDAERPVDQYLIVQQVSALVQGYMSTKDEIFKLKTELATRNEDNRRLEARLTAANKKIDALEGKA